MVKPQRIARFRRHTLDSLVPSYGEPLNRDSIGYLGLSKEDKERLGVNLGAIIDITRNDIDSCYKATIVPGEYGVVAITGDLRKSLGLDSRDESGFLNSMVELSVEGDEIVIKIVTPT